MGGKSSKGGYSVQVVNVRKTGDEDQARNVSTGTPDPAPAPPTFVAPSTDKMETVVGKAADFKDGHMQEVEVGDQKVLLVKEEGQLHALSAKCTHYNAPLAKGVYCKGVVRCPWHGACFNVKTGDIEDFPGLDSLHKYEVEVRGEDVVVKADPSALESTRRVKPMVRKAADPQQTVVIIGGGPASVVCAETLRQEGFTGSVVLVSQEHCLPYQRIKLSKVMTLKAEELALRPQEFYDSHDIELMLGRTAIEVSTADRKVTLDHGTVLRYDKLVIATGGQPRKLPIPGSELANVYMLRTPSDANSIVEKAQGKNVVILGSSFIGLEVATSLVSQAASVTVIGRNPTPLEQVFGTQIGQWFCKMHEAKGVKFHFETSVQELRGQEGKLVEAVLADGTLLPADLCVMGVGVVPATNFLKHSGVNITDRGFLPVTKGMQTNVSNVYGAGDIVEFPLFTQADQLVNVQHWQMASMHGRIAGQSIAGKSPQIHSVPFFWTAQFGKNVRYAGYGPGYDDIVFHGDVNQDKFIAYYTKGERVVAVASLGSDPIAAQLAELMSGGGHLSKEEVKTDPTAWVSRLTPS